MHVQHEKDTARKAVQRLPRLLGAVLLVLGHIAISLPTAHPALAAGGSYTLKWYAADPAVNNGQYLPTYAKLLPSQLSCPTPSGGTGRAADPLQDAVAYSPTNGNRDAVTSLAPKDMALGQVVPFELEITVSGSVAPENGVISFTVGFNTHTSSGGNFGYDPAYMVYCAFVDTADPGTFDPGGDAKVDSFTSILANPGGGSTEEIQGTFQVSGLDDGDTVIVEIWVVLKSIYPAGTSGNVPTRLISAQTVYTPPATINTGNQTVALLQVQKFASAEADVSVTKADAPDPVLSGSQLTYTVVATNNSTDTVANGIVVTDTLDSHTTYVSSLISTTGGSCSAAAGVLTCNVGALSPGQSATITIVVRVNDDAPIAGTVQTGTCTTGGTGGVDLCNRVSITAITADPTPANNTDSEPTNAQADLGDLPDSYGTTLTANGARHSYSGLTLGAALDGENDGVPTAGAIGDDTSGVTPDDEDGVVLAGTQWEWENGTGTFQLTVSGGSGCLNAWMDFTDDAGTTPPAPDGNFTKTGGYDTATVNATTYSEHIIQNLVVTSGTHAVTVAVPPGLVSALNNDYYVRFRLSPSCGTIAPTGLVAGGEVEDYLVELDSIPTRVVISRFDAWVQDDQVIIEWETAAEINTAGFFLYREDRDSGQMVPVNEGIVPAFLGAAVGGTYTLPDPGARPGGTYVYTLQEIEALGQSHTYGPFEVTAEGPRTVEVAPPGPGLPYTRMARPASLGKQPSKPQPNKSTDVPRDLPKELGKSDTRLPGLPTVEAPGEALRRYDDEPAVPASTVMARLTVREDGLYYLDASDIAVALGLNVAQVARLIQSTQLKLTNQGDDIAYLAASGNEGLYFYAEGLDDPYAADNVYWLQRAKGQSMGGQGGRSPAGVALSTFPVTSHAEQNVVSALGLFNDPAADFWMWGYVVAGDPYNGSRSFSVLADGAAAQGPASITAWFMGNTDSGVGADHHAQLKLNGTFVGDAVWSGAIPYEVSLPVDPALLRDGANTIEIVGVLDPGVPYSIFLVDSFDVSYQRSYKALDDVLAFSSVDNQAVTVYGFDDTNIMVFDISNPKRPTQVSAIRVEASDGAFRVTFKPAAAGLPYLAVTTAAVPRITTLEADTPSALQGSNGADYVIITPASLVQPAQVLAAYRQGQGLQAQVIDVQDIYDEFNGGVVSPQALRSFLAYAYANWLPAPRYVLLAGAGSFDYKNYLGYGDSLVPPILVGTIDILRPADGSYADVEGDDGAPEIAVGRLPVLTQAEFEVYIAKIRAYEASDPAGWSTQVLLLADNSDPEAGDFPADSEVLAGALPAGYTVQRVYLGPLSVEQARSQALTALSAGVGVFNYTGHAGLNALAAEKLLTGADVPNLHNSPRLAFMSAATCAMADYGLPGYRSLGMLLSLQGDGGAAAVFGPTGSSFNADGVALVTKLFQNLSAGDSVRVGDATRAALAQFAADGGPRYALDTYSLLGDPAMEMVWR